MHPSLNVLPHDVVERSLVRWPLPLADAVEALEGSRNPHERRDRIVEVFRTALRFVASIALAGTVRHGLTTPSSEEVEASLLTLRRRGLTDGQWVGLTREILRPGAAPPADHYLPPLVELFHGSAKPFRKALDGLLAMRRTETVAHGSTGDEDEIASVIRKRASDLQTFLVGLETIWERVSLVVPLAPDDPTEPQRAWRLMGTTPRRGRWRQVSLAPGVRLPQGEPVLIEANGHPVLALAPVVQFRTPSPESIAEIFVLDGGIGSQALFVALPSMAQHREGAVWEALDALFRSDQPSRGPGEELGCPYQGLESFVAARAALFFGRERESEALANRVRSNSLVTVTGASGAGKSSLIQAGVIPRLHDHDVQVLRPGHHPLRRLVALLEGEWGGASGGPAGGPLDARILDAGRRSPRPLLLVVDQAEEIFTLCASAEERAGFAEALAGVAAADEGRVRLILSLREDYFARTAGLPHLGSLSTRCVEVVVAPDREALRRTLEDPLRLFGFEFDPGVCDAMLDAVEGEPAALALLQFCAACLWERRDRTWKRLSRSAYEAMRGVEGALATHADAAFAGLTPSQQGTLREMMRRLVTAEGTRAVVARDELVGVCGTEADVAAILDRMVDSRLLCQREGDAGGTCIELAHEALLEHWDRLREWREEDRIGRRMLHAVRTAAAQWDERSRPEGLLWRGEAFDELRVWRRHADPARLTAMEADFVDACERASHAEETAALRAAQTRQRVAWGIALVAVTGALGFGALAWTANAQWKRSEQAGARAEIERQNAIVQRVLADAERAGTRRRLGEALLLQFQLHRERFGESTDQRPESARVEQRIEFEDGTILEVFALDEDRKTFVETADRLLDPKAADFELPAEHRQWLNEHRAAIAFTTARIFFVHNRFPEARKRFRSIIDAHPTAPEAGYAAGLLVDSHLAVGDLERVSELCEEFVRKPVGQGDKDFRTTWYGAEFKLLLRHADARGDLATAEGFARYLTRFPDSPYVDLARHNAAYFFERAGAQDRAQEFLEPRPGR